MYRGGGLKLCSTECIFRVPVSTKVDSATASTADARPTATESDSDEVATAKAPDVQNSAVETFGADDEAPTTDTAAAADEATADDPASAKWTEIISVSVWLQKGDHRYFKEMVEESESKVRRMHKYVRTHD